MSENTESNQKIKENQSIMQSTRILAIEALPFDPLKPRLGRRESEPHSEEVSYLYEILHSNFPDARTIWDLHHYFAVKSEEIDVQFDISFFRDLKIDYTLSSYRASNFNNRVPTMVINLLSKSTWQMDVGIHADYCRLLKIPLYIVFSPFYLVKAIYKPPFLRAYILQPDGDYHLQELNKISVKEGDPSVNRDALLDVSKIVPFNLGIMELVSRHEGGLPRYRLILINPQNYSIYQTTAQKEKARAEQEKARAEQEKARAEQEKARAEQEKARADKLQKELNQYQKRV
jgi:Uma2 family endonuclease